MKNNIFLVVLWASLGSFLSAQEKLERGKDRVDIPAQAEGLILHNMFQSGMVIQREKPIRIWGWAEAGEKVSVTFGEQTQSAIAAADRTWKVELPAMQASSTPTKLLVQGQKQKIERDNILIGDIWVLSGQSNMEFEIAKVDNGDLEIASANFKNIRLFTMPHLNGFEPQKSFPILYQWSDWSSRHYRQGYWDLCTPETVRDMSAIGFVFARRIHLATQVPIGIVDVSRGGTTLETWIPTEVLKTVDTVEVKAKLAEWDAKVAAFDPQKDLEQRIKNFQDRAARLKAQGKELPPNSVAPSDLKPGPAFDQNRPGNCYASMLAPIAGFQVKGVIWHQGYNNALQPNGHVMYHQLFAKMIDAWRAAFQDPQLPFGIISLCTAGDPQDQDDYLERMVDEGIFIRAVQYQTFLELYKAGDKNIGFASSFDQRRSWYHPQIKVPVGERISRWALATQYGMAKQIRWLPPMLKEMFLEPGEMRLQLDSPAGPFNDGAIEGFAIAGPDGLFQPAKAEWLTKKDSQGKAQQNRSMIVLTSPLVPEPRYFRYAWGRNPLANLKSLDHTDLPFATQRSDTWTMAGMYEKYTQKKPVDPNLLDGREIGELRNALKTADLQRRLWLAKELLQSAEKPKKK
ncbi:MAG: sialate O-acetylesterase [Zavarzinella sp.]